MAKLTLIEACDKAVGIISQTGEVNRLYQKAVQSLGEGQLRNNVLGLAAEAIEDEELAVEVFASNESIVSFFCGVWMQFLLVEVAGVKKDKLKMLAQQAFKCSVEGKCIH